MAQDNEWSQPSAPPPPLFAGKKERDLVKQVNDELIERVIGQQVVYYPIDHDSSPYHDLYGEAIKKTFLPPVRVHVLVEWEGIKTSTPHFGLDKEASLVLHFHKRRLTEDQNLFVREGDFVVYGSIYYEIVTIDEPREIFGQAEKRIEISAKCIRAREGLFDAT